MATDEVTHTTLSAHVPIELARQVRAAAKATDTPPSRWIARALEQRLARLAASSSKVGGSGSSEGVADDVHIGAPVRGTGSTAGSAGASAPRATRDARVARAAAAHKRATSAPASGAETAREANPIPKGAPK